jgi:hypothetical protein
VTAQQSSGLRVLVEEVGRFYVRDRDLTRAQKKMEQTLAGGAEPSESERRAYVSAVRRYFSGFEREAQSHLRAVDARLKRINQEQFNLTAERGVAARRVEATQHVLSVLADVGEA